MNQLDPIEELYDMYSDEKETPRIVEVTGEDLGFDSDLENRPVVIIHHFEPLTSYHS